MFKNQFLDHADFPRGYIFENSSAQIIFDGK